MKWAEGEGSISAIVLQSTAILRVVFPIFRESSAGGEDAEFATISPGSKCSVFRTNSSASDRPTMRTVAPVFEAVLLRGESGAR